MWIAALSKPHPLYAWTDLVEDIIAFMVQGCITKETEKGSLKIHQGDYSNSIVPTQQSGLAILQSPLPFDSLPQPN
jgi:hypothetical protein